MLAAEIINPLSRFQAWNTRVADEFRDVVLGPFGGRRVRIDAVDGFEASGSMVPLKDLMLTFAASSSPLTIDYPAMNWIRIITRQSGRARVALGNQDFQIDERHSLVIASHQRSTSVIEAQHGWLTLRIKPEALVRYATAWTGSNQAPIAFDPVLDNDRPDVRMLTGLVRLLAYELNDIGSDVESVMVSGLEDMILRSLLRLGRAYIAADDEPAASHAQARLVAEYIESNRDRNVSVPELAAIANVSVRALHRTFKRVYGCTPNTFAKQRRLWRARELLESGDMTVSVTSVSLKCGFSNLGNFAKDYEVLFGEKPSQTLRRNRPASSRNG